MCGSRWTRVHPPSNRPLSSASWHINNYLTGFYVLSYVIIARMESQVQPATLASLVGALNLRSINSNPAAKAAVRALGEDECTSSSTPPQLEYARPAWTQSLAQSREASSSGYHSQAPLAIPATVRYIQQSPLSVTLSLLLSDSSLT